MSDASIEKARLVQAERSLILKVSSSWPAPECSRDAGERRAAAVRPARLGSHLWAVLLVLALFAGIIASTALLKAPQHGVLSGGFDRDAYEFLLRTNSIRIVAWSV